MSEDRYPDGVPCWIDTGRADPKGAVAFYGGVFGWEFDDRAPAGSDRRYLVARVDGQDVAGVGEQPEQLGRARLDRLGEMTGPPAWNTYVRVASADEAAARVGAAGGRTLIEPFDVGAAGRMAAFADPEGASFCVWEAGEHRGAELVNAPGSWVSSELNTHDREAAIGFYDAVFGWEGGDADLGLLLLAGYGDHLERRDPELRNRLREWKAPERFEDTVAWITSLDGNGDTRAHWSVTFAVEDADATARRAAELGGRVVVEPFDTPWVRAAVLCDPEGALFSIGKFTPPS